MSDSDDYVPKKRPAAAVKSRAQDSSDDDLPIAQLAKKHKKVAAPMESDSDDNVLLSELPKKAAAKTKSQAKPAAKPKATPAKSAAAKKLVAKKGAVKKATPAKKGDNKSPKGKPAAAKARSPAAKKKASAKKKAPKRKTNSREQDQASGDKLITRSGVLYETKKGEMVQKLLCRWWYAMEWPAKEDLKAAPPSYEALEGYPGVFICVEGDNVGKLLDARNKATCPCYTNFANKTSEELKGLLEMALTKQKEALVAHWGENVDEEAKLDRELKWLKSVDPTKTDRAAVRALALAKINN